MPATSMARIRKRIVEYCEVGSLKKFERRLVGYRARRLEAEMALEALRVFAPVMWCAQRPRIILENWGEYEARRRRIAERRWQRAQARKAA